MKNNYLSQNQINDIADLHSKALPTGFLPKLGNKFLRLLYTFISTDKDCFLYSEYSGEEISGFICGTLSTKKLYKRFLLRYFILACFYVLPKVLTIQMFKKVVETLMIPFMSNKEVKTDLPNAELLVICVNESFRGQGVASALFNELIMEFRNEGIYQFKIIVGNNLDCAHQFYLKMGANRISTMSTHKENKSVVYVYKNEKR